MYFENVSPPHFGGEYVGFRYRRACPTDSQRQTALRRSVNSGVLPGREARCLIGGGQLSRDQQRGPVGAAAVGQSAQGYWIRFFSTGGAGIFGGNIYRVVPEHLSDLSRT